MYNLNFISEQQYFELEKQLITANSKLEAEANSSSELKEKHQELGKFVRGR